MRQLLGASGRYALIFFVKENSDPEVDLLVVFVLRGAYKFVTSFGDRLWDCRKVRVCECELARVSALPVHLL